MTMDMPSFMCQTTSKNVQTRHSQRIREVEETMLVLTRRLGESICINDDIKIVIQSIKGHQVRVGITAPRETVIHREEIYQRIQREKQNQEEQDS